jgi:hypothetical protein
VNTLEQIANRALILALPVAIAGAGLKLMHWNGANILLLVGLSSVALASLLKYAAQDTLDGVLFGLAIFLACIGVLFKLMHWPYGSWIIDAAVVAGIIWGIRSFRETGGPEEKK